MSAYATDTDFEEYVEGWTTDDSDALDRLLERASRDVDIYIGPRTVDNDSGLKFGDVAGDENPSDLLDWQLAALRRATCAQAEYRFQMGEEFMVAGQFENVSGPDFSRTGKLPYFAPKARRELVGTGLVVTGVRAAP